MWFSLASMRERWGDAAGLAVARASREAIDGVEAFCRDEGVDAWFRRGGYLQVSTAPAHDGVWDEAVAACRDLERGPAGGWGTSDGAGPGGADPGPVRVLSPDEVAGRCASPAFRGAAFYEDAATVQPARLALGLRERLLAAGVEIYERSPGAPPRRRSLLCPQRCVGKRQQDRQGGGVVATTEAGVVRAGAAIVAIGGAAKSPHGPLRNALTVTSSHIVLTEPVPELLEQIGWTGGECITDSRALVDYFRTTPDGRIAFGWGGGRIAMGARLRGRSELDADVVAAAAERLNAYFPGLAEQAHHPRLGRPDRRLADPRPARRPSAGQSQLRRRRLHRQRRRPLPHGRPHPRLPRPRPPRRPLPPSLRRPHPAAGAAGALPLARRGSNPTCAYEPGER